jgi:flavodoxin
MRKRILCFLGCLALLQIACEKVQASGEEQQEQQNGQKVLVACFSFTGNTKAFAEKIANITGGELYMIVPEETYGSENSNYYDESTRAYKEQYGPASFRPSFKKTLENASAYDVIILGSPIWYGKSPRVILSFLDAYGFSGKIVIPFVTSASTGISNVNSELPATYPDIKWKEGKRLSGMSDDQLKSWLKGLGL